MLSRDSMIDIKEIADKVYRLETLVRGMTSVFAVYFIKESQGVLIEPCPAAIVTQIRQGMRYLGMKDLAYIIPTHIHVDHAGGAGKLAQIFPQAKVLIHPAGLKHVIDPTRLIESTKTVFGADFEDIFGRVEPVPESQTKVPEDGEIISVGSRELQIIYAPGHAPHHIAVFDRSVKGLFCGEALGLPVQVDRLFPLPAVAPPSFDQELSLETMEKLRRLKARLLFYSHDGVGREPDKLISIAAENTRLLGDLILKALRDGQTDEAISRRVGEYVASRFGLELSELDLAMTVGAYILYFRKKGLA